MALFSKKEDSKIPDIPSLPGFPDGSREKGLPSLPQGFNREFDRDIIKSALNEESALPGEGFQGSAEQHEGTIPTPPKEVIQSVHLGHSEIPEKFGASIISARTGKEKLELIEGPDSIFVRIDKFKSAKKELSEVKRNLLEAEAIINKIYEIKVKEDSEVNDLNLSLDSIKKKIDEVDSLVFDKV